jgi:hypothetical protein
VLVIGQNTELEARRPPRAPDPRAVKLALEERATVGGD